MTGSLFLQIFLLVNVFLMGVLAVFTVRHAIAHFGAQEPKKIRRPTQAVRLPADVREHLLETAQDNFQSILDHSATEFETNLAATTAKLSDHLEKLGTEIVTSEMASYRTDLENLRKQAEAAISGTQTEIVEHRNQLRAQLETEMADEKKRLIQQIDTKLADAVASFLIETMQHNIDLGAQTSYLTSILEEHKADFGRELYDEA